MTSAVGGYAFGDSAPAARRLGPLADLFEPTTRIILERSPAGGSAWPSTSAAAPAPPAACSPRAWVRAAPSASTSRSRSSPRAGAAAQAGGTFAVHDVRSVPFPAGGPAGLLFCRLLL